LSGPIAGFIGLISDRMDLGLVQAVAETGTSVLMVGARQSTFTDDAGLARLLARDNVQWVGSKRFDELPSYLRLIDVGLVPYRNSEFNRASFPLKILEYLAAGRPVVTTPLPAVQWLGTPLIVTAETPEDFARLAAIHAETSRSPEQVEQRRAFAATHSWSKRVEQLATVLGLDEG
jgi:teichuronic acid biosynthesis glycosyltransferase TuaH